MQPLDILILSNGPGELATWVQPTVRAIRQVLGSDPAQVRISLVLSPCPHANGQEAAIARQYPGLDRVQAAEAFWTFLVWGKTTENWDWRSKGVVLFLGGDQFFTLWISRRLGYASVIYAEWEARWLSWVDAVGAMNDKVLQAVPHQYQTKIKVVGDLITEVTNDPSIHRTQATLKQVLHLSPETELIGLLPGSKSAKLTQGVPLLLAIAEQIHQKRPQTRFVIPVAPGLPLETLAKFGDAQQNPWTKAFGNSTAQLVYPVLESENQDSLLPYLETQSGLQIQLSTQVPHYGLYGLCQFCLTTVGANTAELGALGVPMIVLLPTQQLDAMRSWDGLPGLIANLPGVGSYFAQLINWFAQRHLGLLAWPNIWAGHALVPELVGHLNPQTVAELALLWLADPQKQHDIRTALQAVRGKSGAAMNLAGLVAEQAYKHSLS